MSPPIQDTGDGYKHADVSVRLHLFLTFPELRKLFLNIDQEAMAAERFASEGKRGRHFHVISRLFRRAARVVSDARMARSVDGKLVTPIFR